MNVRRIYKEFDRESQQILRGRTTACQKLKCDACCGFAVEVLEPEVTVVKQAIAALGGTVKAEVERRARGWAVELERRGLTSWVKERDRTRSGYEDRYADKLGLMCPLLNSAGRCSIYADRPLSCRYFVSLGDRECEPRGVSPRPVSLLALRVVACVQMQGDKPTFRTYNLGQVVGEVFGLAKAEPAEEPSVRLEASKVAVEWLKREVDRPIYRAGCGGSR